jgi:uncharacterized protein YbjT (DUF2867 family)
MPSRPCSSASSIAARTICSRTERAAFRPRPARGGPTGQQGGATARALLERGWPVRALVRDRAAGAARALQQAGARLVAGDLDDPESVRAALDGAHGVFLVLTMMAGPRVSLEGVAAEVRRGQPGRFVGRRVEIAGDYLTGPQIADAFGRAAGIPSRFEQVPIEQLRAFDEQVARMFAWMDTRAGSPPDLAALRADHTGLMTLRDWLRATGWAPRPPASQAPERRAAQKAATP